MTNLLVRLSSKGIERDIGIQKMLYTYTIPSQYEFLGIYRLIVAYNKRCVWIKQCYFVDFGVIAHQQLNFQIDYLLWRMLKMKILIGALAALYGFFVWTLCRAASIRDREEEEIFDEYTHNMNDE